MNRLARPFTATRGRCGAAFLLLLATTMPSRVSAQDLSGAWNVRWAQAVRVNGDGSVEIQNWGDAELVVNQVGGQVTGTWTTNVLERVQWTVYGTIEDGTLRLQATENDSTNEELAIVERIELQATASEDTMEGHVFLVIRGRQRAPGRRPFTATRAGNR